MWGRLVGYLPSRLGPAISNQTLIFLLSAYMAGEEVGLQGSREQCFQYQKPSPCFGL